MGEAFCVCVGMLVRAPGFEPSSVVWGNLCVCGFSGAGVKI